jgi:fatty-acyl-CoA synthase
MMADSDLQWTPRNHEGPTIPDAVHELRERNGVSLRFLRPGDEPAEYTYVDVYDRMMARGRSLAALGLGRGDRLAIILPEPEDFVLTFLGAMAFGIVPVPMYPPLGFGKLDAYIASSARIARKAGARALVTDARVQNILWSLIDEVEPLERIVTVEKLDATPGPAVERPQLTLDDLAFLQFTSGSTSAPKGVMVTHGNLLANLDGIMNIGLEIDEDDVAVSWLPLYHDMGLIGFMLAPVWYAVPTTYMSPVEFVKHARRWMETIDRYRGTIAFAPNFAYALATKRTRGRHLEGYDLSCLKALGCGAEPNHPGTLNGFLDHFAPAGLPRHSLLPCYGMAEATLAMTFVGLREKMKVDRIDPEAYQVDGIAEPSDDDTALEYVSCGRPFPRHEIVVVGPDDEELPERRVGEVVFRGPSVAKGYFDDAEKTAETFSELGLHTGDLGYIADGELYVTGRKKDLIILNGRNYDPQSIEWVVQEVDGVRKGNVVAFSVPGERTEELVVVAEVKGEVDNPALVDAIGAAVRDELMIAPADVALVPRGALPKTSSGKLQRAKTRADYLDGTLGKEGVRLAGAKGDSFTLARHVAKSAVSRAKHKVKRGIKNIVGDKG